MHSNHHSFYASWGKRAFDRIIAVLMLVVLSPVLLVTTVLIWIFMGQPVLFRQVRPGRNGKPFTIYKFRTMTAQTNKTVDLQSDRDRLTALGKILRATRIDEFPQLLNVLAGEMSLVGPRPLLLEYLERYTEHEARRHEVLPGITGWAQIHGGNRLDWAEKFDRDVWYVDHLSFTLDVTILWRTFVFALKSVFNPKPDEVTATLADPVEVSKGDRFSAQEPPRNSGT